MALAISIAALVVAFLTFVTKVWFDYSAMDSHARRELADVRSRWMEAAASRSRRAIVFTIKLAALGFCGLVVYVSGTAVYDFVFAGGPIGRLELLKLLGHLVLFVFYVIFGIALLALLMQKKKEQTASSLILTRREGETIWLSADPGADAHEIYQALTGTGVAITIEKIQGSRVKLAVKAPTAISVGRDEPVKI